jgi:hypothetical protein
LSVVVTKLYGGLGNQMFQYAAGLGLADRLDTELAVDTSWFRAAPDPDRPYALSAFGISPEQPLGVRTRTRLRRPRPFRESGYGYDPAVEALRGDVLLDGYWQDERYFAHCAERVRNAFRPALPLPPAHAALLAELRAQVSVSLHIRRGDYTSAKRQRRFGLLSLEYYDAATAYMAAAVPDATFLVFSDDLEWCRENLREPGLRFSPSGPAAADLALMAACQHNVVANSSFSWWGAWLNPNPDKIVVAPEQWFQAPELRDASPAPQEWIRV